MFWVDICSDGNANSFPARPPRWEQCNHVTGPRAPCICSEAEKKKNGGARRI